MANFKTTPLMSGLYGSMRYKPETVAALPDAKPFQYDPLGQLGQSQPAPSMGYQAYEPPKLTRQSIEVKPIRTRFAEFYHHERRIQEEAADMDALEKMQADMEMEQRKYERLLAMNSQFRSKLFPQAPQAPGMPQMTPTELGGAALGGLITGDWENAIGASYGMAQGREQQAYQGQMQEFERQQGMAQFDYREHLSNLERQGNKVAGAEKRLYDLLMGREASQQKQAEQDQKFQQDVFLGQNRPMWERQAEFNDLAERYGPEVANQMLAAKYQKDIIGNEAARWGLTKSQFMFPYEVREAALKNGISEANIRKIEAEIAYLPQDKQLERAKFLLDQAYKAAQVDAGNADRSLRADTSNQDASLKHGSTIEGLKKDRDEKFKYADWLAGTLNEPNNPITKEPWSTDPKVLAQERQAVADMSRKVTGEALDLNRKIYYLEKAGPPTVSAKTVNVPPPVVQGGAVQLGNMSVQLGLPYVYGGDNLRKGVDCSGLVLGILNEGFDAGLGDMTAASMHGSSKFAKVENQKQLQPHDLIFFYTDSKDPKRVSHVGMYIGGNKMLHSSRRAGTAVVNLDTYPYRNRIAGFRRLK